MIPNNRKRLSILAVILVGGYVSVGALLYEYAHHYALDQNQKKLDQILLNQRALHSYLENQLKPVIYQLKDEGKLYKDFFNPQVLSFTYIARGIHHELNALRQEANTTPIYYKLATDNPRNPINQATPEELRILTIFRQHKDQVDYSRVIDEGGHAYIYYAIPVEPNRASCMKCHSSPDKAPRELIEQYGSQSGFGESVGTIRAIISLKMPFDDELSEANRIFQIVMGVLGIFLVLFYGVIVYFFRKLDKSHHIIEEKNDALLILAEHDGLTGLCNRRRFDSDLAHWRAAQEFGLIILDIDRFKHINDTYGHPMGDQVLRSLAHLIQMHIDSLDVVYRIGGEEFAILLHDSQKIESLAQTLLLCVGEYDFGIKEHLHISIGMSVVVSTDTPSSLFKRVDDALYLAKQSGRNRAILA